MSRPPALAVVAALALMIVATACSSAGPEPSTRASAAGSAGSAECSPASPPAEPSTTAHTPRLSVHQMAGRLPRPVAREAAVLLPGRHHVLVAGGLVSGDVSSAATYTIDVRSGAVARRGPLPTAVHDTAGAVVGGHVLVIGGGNSTEQSLVQARGRRGHRRSGWRVLGRLPTPVRYPGVVVNGGAVWVFGGERNGTMVDAVQRVDLSTGEARVVAHLPRALGHEAAMVLGDRVLLAGGRSRPDRLTARMWWFDPSSREFSHAGRLRSARADAAVVAGGGGQGTSTAYLLGGETPDLSDRILRVHRGQPTGSRVNPRGCGPDVVPAP